MSYKNKRILTDSVDRAIPQFFDEVAKDFKPQSQVATEKTAKSIERALIGSRQVKEEPPRLKNITLTKGGYFVHWFHEGFFYASFERSVYKSVDGIAWQMYHTFPHVGELKGIESIMVSDSGRMIAATFGGEVFISGEDGVFTDTPTFVSGGQFYRGWGHFKCGNVMGLNTYDAHGMTGTHEAFISVDNGATFKKVFDNTTFATLPAMVDESHHLHDMEYDPYSGRVYLWQGDGSNRTMYYSDNFGETWLAAFPRGVARNTTQVLATPYGLALGTDTAPGGVNYLHIDRSKRIDPVLSEATLELDFWNFSTNQERYVAYRKWIDREKGIYLIPFVGEYSDNGYGSIAYSKDGYQWHLLHKTFAKGHYFGFQSVVYGNGKIVASHHDNKDGYSVFVAEVDLG